MKVVEVFNKVKGMDRKRDWQMKFVLDLIPLIRKLNLGETVSFMKKLEEKLEGVGEENNPYTASLGMAITTIVPKFWEMIKKIESDERTTKSCKKVNRLITTLPFSALYSLTSSLKKESISPPNTVFECNVATLLLSRTAEIVRDK